MDTARRLDFPTLGKPTSPTSAIIFSSRIIFLSLAAPPASAKLGACLTEFLKLVLPLPPLPPLAATKLSPSSLRSLITRPVSSSMTTVPTGTLMMRSWPFFPKHFFFMPSWPFSASYFFLYLKSIKVRRFLSARKTMFPPLPPSPPSGPPSGTKGSRLKDTQPLPPFPDLIVIFALSANMVRLLSLPILQSLFLRFSGFTL